MTKTNRCLALCLGLIAGMSTAGMMPWPALAQDTAARDAAAAVAPGEQVETLPPAYEEQMLRLSEILGSLHFLRELCGAKEGQTWREQMEALLEKEEPTQARREHLISRFNHGFRGFEEIYRECTPAAAEAANRYLRQGARLAAEIPNRYGN